MPSNLWIEAMTGTDRRIATVRRIAIEDEIVYVTRQTTRGEIVMRSDTSGGGGGYYDYPTTITALEPWALTVTRGREGTEAVSHAVGAVVDWDPAHPEGWTPDTWETPE